MSRQDVKFTSYLGCNVQVVKAEERVGDGVLLELSLDLDGDRRRAEVFLSDEDVATLRWALLEVNSSEPPYSGYRWSDRDE